MKIAVGETISGVVTEINQTNGNPDSIILSIGGKKKAIIPLTELPEDMTTGGQGAVRHLARKYMNRKLIGTVVNINPLTLSYNEAVKHLTTKITLNVGDEIDATVVWTSKNYAELEYQNMPLSLSASEFGWLKYVDLRSALNRGQRIKVEVLEVEEDGTVRVSHKKFARNPWPKYQEKYQKRNQYLARVKSLNKVGVVVSLEPGLDILCSPYPFFEVKVNDDVAVEIVDINPEQGKMKGFITAQANRA
jgi:ribosomal protein S1